jgi:hypothetical protein
MRYTPDHPYADPETAARKLIEIAYAAKSVQDGRIYIEDINAPFLKFGKPAQYRAGLNLAVERGWLWLHESGTFVKLAPAATVLLA